MKFMLYIAGLAFALGLGFRGGILRRNKWRAFCATLLISTGIIGGLDPPIVGTFRDAIIEMRGNNPSPIHVLVPREGIQLENDSTLKVQDVTGARVTIRYDEMGLDIKTVMAQSKQKPLLLLTRPITHDIFHLIRYSTAPSVMLPHIPNLGERARILFFHVPTAWTGFLAYVVTMLFSIRYLKYRRTEDDAVAVASASIGTLFTVLAYISGAIWAKFNWGNFFNWDTRELSVLLLLAIYAAYFVLRLNIHSQAKNRVAATYAIVAAAAALFLIFIVPRITASLHPGSRDDSNIGPILSPEQDALDMTKAIIFSIMLSGFTFLYTWMLNLTARYKLIQHQLDGDTQ